MKNKKIKAGKNFFLGKIRYRFFLMVCMIPLLAVHPKQDADSHEDCNHIELVASEETGSEITRCLHNNGEGNGNIRIPDEVVTLKLILPFTKEPQDVTLVVYDGIAYMEGDIQIGRIDELKKKALEKGFGIKVTGNKWTNGIIPFKIDPTFSVGQRGSIRGAMDHIGRSTNLCFEDKEPGDANYIYFNRIYTGHPNAHGIGMMGGQQNVSIYDHTRHGVIVHEILHIAGLRHEHVRPDRDNHVIVNDGKGGNPDFIMNDPILDAAYAKVAAGGQYVTYGNYDYQSIMHYDSYYQGNCIWTEKTGKINCDVATINAIIAEINVHGHNTPTYGRFQFMPTMFSKPGREEMGQRDAMSNGDITAINTIYPVKDPNCKQKIIPVPVVEDPPIIRIEIECTPFEMNSYDNPVKSSSQNIRLAPGFRVPKGAFFHAYIGDCPTECEDKSSDILGCCQFENFTMPSVSERWCCQQENSISFTENGVNAYGICSKPIPDEVGTCYRCSVINGVNQVESIAPYNTQALCDTDPAYTWTTDIVSIGDDCPTGCFGVSDGPATGCCILYDPIMGYACGPTSEWECCTSGGQFIFGNPSQCDIGTDACGSGSGSGSGAPKVSNDIEVEIFPNPNSGTFTFKLDSPLEGILDMKIFDMMGRMVYEEASSYIFSGEYQKEIQLPVSLADGVYNIKVIVGEGQINKKIVIQR